MYQLNSLEKKPFFLPGFAFSSIYFMLFLQSSLFDSSQARQQASLALRNSPCSLQESPSQAKDTVCLLSSSVALRKQATEFWQSLSLKQAAPLLWQLMECLGSMFIALLWHSTALSYSRSLQQAAPRLRWQAATLGFIWMALLVSSTFCLKSISLPTALPLRLQKSQLLASSSARSRPLSQATDSSFQRLRCRQELASRRYFSRVLGMLVASSSNSLYCFLDLRVLILSAVSLLVVSTMGRPSSKSHSSTSIPDSIINSDYHHSSILAVLDAGQRAPQPLQLRQLEQLLYLDVHGGEGLVLGGVLEEAAVVLGDELGGVGVKCPSALRGFVLPVPTDALLAFLEGRVALLPPLDVADRGAHLEHPFGQQVVVGLDVGHGPTLLDGEVALGPEGLVVAGVAVLFDLGLLPSHDVADAVDDPLVLLLHLVSLDVGHLAALLDRRHAAPAVAVAPHCRLHGAEVGVVPRLVLEVDELLRLLDIH